MEPPRGFHLTLDLENHMFLMALLTVALAAPPSTGMDLSYVTEGELTENDVEVFLREDGQVYLADELVSMDELTAGLKVLLAERPELRVVVASDRKIDKKAELQIIEIARAAGAWHVALEVPAGTVALQAAAPMFAGAAEAPVVMGGATAIDLSAATPIPDLTEAQLMDLKPKRQRFPQNPYASTDFTAYTLEWGEVKLGLVGVDVGILPRVQVGTVPVLDALGLWNINAKVNAMRLGPIDGAVLGQFYYVPFTDLLDTVDGALNTGLATTAAGQDLWTSSITYAGLGGRLSLQVLRPWSLHGGLYVGRIQAEGMYDLANLPPVIVPGVGVDLTGSLMGNLTPSVGAQVTTMNLATDLRFNRRDSIVVQFSSAVSAQADAALMIEGTGVADELPGEATIQFVYSAKAPMGTTWASSIAYQASWPHLELRLGLGASAPIPYRNWETGETKKAYSPTWAFQAFNLAYRFGGETRREESRIRRGYRRNVRDLNRGGDRQQVVP